MKIRVVLEIDTPNKATEDKYAVRCLLMDQAKPTQVNCAYPTEYGQLPAATIKRALQHYLNDME